MLLCERVDPADAHRSAFAGRCGWENLPVPAARHEATTSAKTQHDYTLSRIGNLDQMPMTFDVPQASTIATKGNKTVNVTSTGLKKGRFTVMLSYMADSRKIPPYVIYQRTLPKETYQRTSSCQASTWGSNQRAGWLRHSPSTASIRCGRDGSVVFLVGGVCLGSTLAGATRPKIPSRPLSGATQT